MEIVVSFILLVFLSVVSIAIGAYHIPPIEIFSTIVGNAVNGVFKVVIYQIRLPRIVFDILVGSGLSVAGASYQGIFKNPLVSPDILGVASGAAFGAALAILLNQSLFIVQFMAFIFGVVSVSLSYILAKKGSNMSILGLVISGIVVGAFFSSLIGFAKYFADIHNQLPEIVFWMMGSFSGVSWCIWPVMIVIFVCTVLLYFMRWHINIASLDDDEAKSLGIDVNLIRKIIIFLSTIITASSVSIVGIVGWVGLVVPHISRLIVGSDNTKVLPMSMLLGGIFLVVADDVARSITSGEIPIGILTSFIGAPFFAYVYRKESCGHVWR